MDAIKDETVHKMSEKENAEKTEKENTEKTETVSQTKPLAD